jgi:endonuclease G, mitochondrial
LLIIITLFITSINNQAQNKPDILCKHFFWGCPISSRNNSTIIIRDIYALSNNDSTKFADWVAYRLEKQNTEGTSKSRNWKADPWLKDEQTLEPDDYTDANFKLNVDRGHQAPLANFVGSDKWYESNYLSNITPQNSEFNQGLWRHLEICERKLLNTYEYLFVITGTLYEKDMGKLPYADEAHVIPSGYWKIIIMPLENKDFQSSSFVFDYKTLNGKNLINYITTINEIEERTGIDFLWQLEDEFEEIKEEQINIEQSAKFF